MKKFFGIIVALTFSGIVVAQDSIDEIKDDLPISNEENRKNQRAGLFIFLFDNGKIVESKYEQ